jgi:hypothetical protein
MADRLGRQAREFILAFCSLDAVVERELRLLEDVSRATVGEAVA